MNASPDIRAAMLAEYARLELRDAELQVAIERAKREVLILRKRLAVLLPALETYGVIGEFDPDGYIIDLYGRGWPTHFIAEVLRNETDRDWSEAEVDRRAHEIGCPRPIGWTAEISQADFCREESDGDEWLERVCGLPEFDDKPTPEPMKALPAPVSIQGYTDETLSTPAYTAPVERVVTPALASSSDVEAARIGKWQTEARLNVLRRLIIEGQTPGQYCPLLAKMPGPPIPDNKAVQNYARQRGWTAFGELRCEKCSGERSAGSVRLCRKCYSPGSGRAPVDPKSEEITPKSDAGIPISKQDQEVVVVRAPDLDAAVAARESPPHPLPQREGVVADTPPPARGVVVMAAKPSQKAEAPSFPAYRPPSKPRSFKLGEVSREDIEAFMRERGTIKVAAGVSSLSSEAPPESDGTAYTAMWTRNRVGLLRAVWATVKPPRDLLAELNALPGMKIATVEDMRLYAMGTLLLLPRPGERRVEGGMPWEIVAA